MSRKGGAGFSLQGRDSDLLRPSRLSERIHGKWMSQNVAQALSTNHRLATICQAADSEMVSGARDVPARDRLSLVPAAFRLVGTRVETSLSLV